MNARVLNNFYNFIIDYIHMTEVHRNRPMTNLHDTQPQSVFRLHEIRRIEQNASALPEPPGLMARAGLAIAELARSLAGDGTSILLLAGPGNNGGDALLAARHLKQWWYKVDVVFTGNANKLPPDAAKAYKAWLESGGTILEDLPEHGCWDLVIDGLFGIGLDRDLDKRHYELVKQVNALKLPVLAIDIPSGLDSETGQAFRAAIKATHTLTFLGLKPGLLTAYGPDYCGEIRLDMLGMGAELLPQTKGRLLAQEEITTFLKPRPMNSHKGMLGSVGVIGGSESMCGAAFLAGRAALKLGAGRVYLGLLADNAPAMDAVQPELMLRTPAHLFELADQLSCLVAGPGLGQSDAAYAALAKALATDLPLVLDADALNLIATHPQLGMELKARKAQSILTPHPAEAARLMDSNTHDIQQDRLGAALVLAGRFNSMVVLKGAGTICALPDESWWVNPTGNPGLSSAGMGDVLSGMIGAFIAQRVNPRQAALLAVYLHGTAADELTGQGTGPIGLTATEVMDTARNLVNRWVYRS